MHAAEKTQIDGGHTSSERRHTNGLQNGHYTGGTAASMSSIDPSSVLSAVAKLVAESPGLADVVSRAAVVLHDLIPFESLYLLRLDRADSFSSTRPIPSGRWTSARTGSAARRACRRLPTTATRDRGIVVTMRVGPRIFGAVWLTSRCPTRFRARAPGLGRHGRGPADPGAAAQRPARTRVAAAGADRQPAPAAADDGRRARHPQGLPGGVERRPRRAAARHAGADRLG